MTTWQLQWRRRGSTSLRSPVDVDLQALRFLAESEMWHSAVGGPSEIEPPSADSATSVSNLLEVDDQLAGIVRMVCGRIRGELGAQPWSRVPPDAITLERASPPSETLLVELLGWRSSLQGTVPLDRFIQSHLPSECRRLAAKQLVVPIPVTADFDSNSTRPAAAAFLQQLHHRSVHSRVLEPFLEGNFELRGYTPRPDAPRPDLIDALLVWEHPRLLK